MKDYKKILEGVVNIINTTEKSDVGFTNICSYIGENCPELKESKDERIRKEILDYIDKATGCKKWVAWLEKQGNTNIFDVPKISIKNAVEVTSRMQYIDDDIKPIAEFIMDYANWNLHKDEWNHPTLTVPLFRVLDALIQKGKPYCECNQNIEKQGEHNPADKAEPKFHKGDWVIDKQGIVHQVANVVENVTNHTYGYDIVGGGYFNDNTEGVRLWTISDAKDGDVLHSTWFHNDCIFIFNGLDNWKFDEPNGDRAVATGYCCLSVSADNMEFGMQGPDCVEVNTVKPATKIQRDTLLKAMSDAGYTFDFDKKELKKIEDEEYNDEDYGIDGLWHAKNILEKTLGKVDGYQTDDGILDHKCAISVIDKLYKQKPAEWSEEDESNFQGIIDVIKENKHHATDYEHMTYYKLLSWFKSLKDRVGNFDDGYKVGVSAAKHNQWKPSEEQIIALRWILNNVPYCKHKEEISGLLDQIKEL